MWPRSTKRARSRPSLQLAQLHHGLERALARLSPEQRAVVELTYFGGCSYYCTTPFVFSGATSFFGE